MGAKQKLAVPWCVVGAPPKSLKYEIFSKDHILLPIVEAKALAKVLEESSDFEGYIFKYVKMSIAKGTVIIPSNLKKYFNGV